MVERSRKQYDDPIEEFNGSGLFNGWRREVMKPRYQHWDGSYTIHSFIHSFLLSLILLASPSSLLSLSLLLSPSSHPLALLSPSFRPLPSTSSRSLLTQISLYFPLFPLPLLFLFSRPLLLLSSSFPLHFPSLILPLLFLFFFYPCHRSRPSPYSLILLSSSTSDLPLLTIFSSSFSPFFLSLSPSFLL